MAWKVGNYLLHVEIDETGKKHEDNSERLRRIHVASGCKYHICIRFNPDKSENGGPPCTYRKNDKYYKYEPEWNYRIPILLLNIREAFRSCLAGENVKNQKIKLCF